MGFIDEVLLKNINTQREQWENNFRKELRFEGDVAERARRIEADGLAFEVLSTHRPGHLSLPVGERWKKAAQTYIDLKESDLPLVNDDLQNGVRLFFFHGAAAPELQRKVRDLLQASPEAEETRAFWLDEMALCASGRQVHEAGGNNVQELAALALDLILKINSEEFSRDPMIAVYLDSQFFKNIAKLRAAKLIALKILQESEIKTAVRVVGLTSYRDWTLYERYSNILKNLTSVASGYIGQADFVQSTGHCGLLELETGSLPQIEVESSRRIARNSCHILALESMLGTVEDAAQGSYHLETLTRTYSEEAWALMRSLLQLSGPEREARLRELAQTTAMERAQKFRKRKFVMAGINDFPNAEEKLGLAMRPTQHFWRTARELELLRLRMEKLNPPRVYVSLFGDFAKLNARLSFVKNYFELLGLKVEDQGNAHSDPEQLLADLRNRTEEIIVVCAADEDYPKISDGIKASLPQGGYLAGKSSVDGLTNIFAGQDVVAVLEKIVKEREKA